MRAEFITEVSLQQPTVIILGSPSLLVRQVAHIFAQQAIPTKEISPETFAHSGLAQDTMVYKFVWAHDSSEPLNQTMLQTVAQKIQTYQSPVIQVVPILTPIEQTYTQYPPFQRWLQQSKAQKQLILALNAALPEAQFVFLQDVVLEHHQKPWHALYFCTATITDGTVADPEIQLSVLSPAAYESALAEQLFRPHSSGSTLIQGTAIASTEIIREMQACYQAYHGVSPRLAVEPVAGAETLPFSVVGLEIYADVQPIVSSWARVLPGPTPVVPNTPSLPQAAVTDPSLPKPVQHPPKAAVPSAASFTSTTAVPPEATKPVPPPPPLVTPSEPVVAASPPPIRQKPVVRKAAAKIPEPGVFDVSDELQRIFKPTRTKQKVSRIVSTAKTQTIIQKKSKRKTGLFYGGLGFIGLGMIVLVLAAVFFATQFLVKRQVAAALQEAVQQQSVSETTQSRLEQLNGFLALQLDAYGTVFDSVLLVQAVSLSELGKELIEVTDNLQAARENTISLALVTLGKDTGNSSEYAQKLALSAQQAYENLSLIQARMEQVELPIGAEAADVVLFEFTEQLRELRQVLAVEQQLHPLLPTLFGQDGRKTYALVFQNDQELRPTGGFIEAVALLKFENGSLIATDVYSSYEIDKKMAGTVTPPEEVKQFLAEENWYLRDSNWDPHFPSTANKIAWFIDKSLGTKVDGVIAINTQTVAGLIEALGPVDLPQFNETLTHRNLAERMEFHSEVVLVDSSSAEHYPKLVLTNVLHKLADVQPEKVTGVLDVLYQSFQSHQVIIALFDVSAAETLATLGWSGEIINPACPTQISSGSDTCVVDELAQVEANVGVNKANYYLKRSITHTVSMQSEQAEHRRQIQYQNTAQSNAWPKGAYRGYIRFYLPHGAQVSAVRFNDTEVAPEQLVQRQELGRPVLGVLIEVPTQQTRVLEVTYATPLPFSNDFAYAFFDQRQPGITDQSHAITFVPRNDQQPVVIAPQADVTPTGIIFSELSTEHSFVGTRFE